MTFFKVPTNLAYQPHLDGVRGLAALAVFLFHIKAPYSSLGFFGVDVFFVLSGYLISSIIASEHQKGRYLFFQFMKKRIVRLYPALLVFLLTCSLLLPFLFKNTVWVEQLKYIFFAGIYSSNFLYLMDYTSIVNHTWTLALEFHFYLLWPFFLTWLLKSHKDKIMITLFCLWVALSLWRAVSVLDLFIGWGAYFRTDTHSTGLVLGSLLAFFDFKTMPARLRAWMFLLLCAAVYFCWDFSPTVGYGDERTLYLVVTMAEIFAVLLIMYPPSVAGFSLLSFKPLVWLGWISYGFYLWHYPIVKWLRIYDFSWETDLAVAFFLTTTVAALSYFLVERPIRHYYYRSLKTTYGHIEQNSVNAK